MKHQSRTSIALALEGNRPPRRRILGHRQANAAAQNSNLGKKCNSGQKGLANITHLSHLRCNSRAHGNEPSPEQTGCQHRLQFACQDSLLVA